MDIVGRGTDLGADLVGVATIAQCLDRGISVDEGVLPGARSVISLAVSQRRAALNSADVAMAQYDTLHAYQEVAHISHTLARELAALGHDAIAVPAFIPLDMSDERQGMIGAVDHRGAAVLAGLGWYGQSGLLVTEGFGPRVRLGSILTTAELLPTQPSADGACPARCRACVNSCPARALQGEGRIDKQSCGKVIFAYGLRGLLGFARQLSAADSRERENLLRSRAMRELWQNFMSGVYYYCFRCQSSCPLGGA